MNIEDLHKQLADEQSMVRVLQDELAETNRGLVSLTMELERRVDERTADLSAAHAELKKTNSELTQLTLELEQRVTRRTADLSAAHAELKKTNSELNQLTLELEQRVSRRTAEWKDANDALRREMEERQQLMSELESALAQVKQLTGLLPICSWCKRIRDEQGNWHLVESYVADHSEAEFSHGVCPDCVEKFDPNVAKKLLLNRPREHQSHSI